MKLAELTWPEVHELDRDLFVIYPIAALEQHSLHLPLFTDSILCEAAALPRDVLLLPIQWLGASAHHLEMAGTLSAEPETCLRVLCEPLRCLLKHGFRRVLVLNGHGDNTEVFHLALRQLTTEFPTALLCGANYWDLAEREIATLLKGSLKQVGHACEFETAMMLHLRPDLVRASQIVDDFLAPVSEALRGVYVPLDMKRQTKQGGHGEPTKATAATGQALFETVIARAIEAIGALRAKPLPTAPFPQSA